MGIINSDAVETNYGPPITNTYVSLAGDGDISLKKIKGSSEWSLDACFSVWHSKNDKMANRKAYSYIKIHKQLDANTAITNIFAHAYNEVKLMLPNTTDDI